MKRILIGAIVGAIILFLCQFLSWALLNFHEKAQKYTPNQEAILSALAANLPEEGGYLLPNTPPGSSSDEMKKAMEDMKGKPWASIQYHKSHEADMTMSMIRQVLTNFLTVFLFCWILGKFNITTFGNVFLSSLAVGLIVFLNAPYTGSIWYKWFDTMAHFGDAMIQWGLIGLWLGWLFNRKTRTA